MPVLGVVEEVLGGIEEGSAGDEAGDDSSEDGEAEGDGQGRELVAGLLSGGPDCLCCGGVEVLVVPVSEVALCECAGDDGDEASDDAAPSVDVLDALGVVQSQVLGQEWLCVREAQCGQ